MTDLNKPFQENTNSPAGEVGSPAVETNPAVAPPETSTVATPPPVQESPITVEASVPPPPTVVVPTNGTGVPKWFYFLFGVTMIVFFVVTTLLVLQLTQNQGAAVPTIAPKITPTSELPTPTLTVMSATDSAVVKFNSLGSSDEVASIEADLKNTDLTVLDQSVADVDSQANSSF